MKKNIKNIKHINIQICIGVCYSQLVYLIIPALVPLDSLLHNQLLPHWTHCSTTSSYPIGLTAPQPALTPLDSTLIITTNRKETIINKELPVYDIITVP